MAVTAMASLSYPPATGYEVRRKGGHDADGDGERGGFVPRRRGLARDQAREHASTEKAAGVNTHTSLRVTSEKPAARRGRSRRR